MDTRGLLADIKAELRYIDMYSERAQMGYLADLVEQLTVVIQEIDQRTSGDNK